MNKFYTNVRFYLLAFSLFLSLGVYLYIKSSIAGSGLQTIRLTETFALIAISYLYLALLIGPLLYLVRLPFSSQITNARRAIGVSAFYFGLLHAYLAFFSQLGGFAGLGFLTSKYLIAISLSFTGLVILSLMAATSFDWVIAKLTFRKWKMLHRFVYIASVFLLIHALMLGTHFQNLSELIPQIFLGAASILLLLEAVRFDNYLQSKFISLPRFGLSLILALVLVLSYGVLSFLPEQANVSLGIHAYHIQLAKDAQNTSNLGNLNPSVANFPGLKGDKTRRFTVSFSPPKNITPNQDVDLAFQVYDASSGNKVQLFNKVYDKVLHLIIVDNELKVFNHIHPDQNSDGFQVTTSFPHPGRYHFYLDFQPVGAIEQQFGFTLDVGKVDEASISTQSVDANLTKTFGDYEVTLKKPDSLKASELSIGNQQITFIINDAKTKQPVTNLKPYLAAFGHLVMIDDKNYTYLHVHPSNLVAPPPNSNGGPSVEFIPLGLYGPIKPGIYRVFAQFNPDNKLFTADFTIKIE